jgi:hypothetical protein
MYDSRNHLHLSICLICLFCFTCLLCFRNKNATTASRHMGMPVPDRPHALVRHCTALMLCSALFCHDMFFLFFSTRFISFLSLLFSPSPLPFMLHFFSCLFIPLSSPTHLPDLHLLPFLTLFFLVLTFFLLVSLYLPFPPPLPFPLLCSHPSH